MQNKKQIEILERALERAKKARKQAEEILEQKSLELYEANQKIAKANQMMEVLLEDKTTQLKIIGEHSPIGIVLTEKGNFISTNSSFENMLGYTKEELLSRTIKDVTTLEDFPESLEFITKLEGGEIDNFTIRKKYVRKDGLKIQCKTNVSAVRDYQGNVKYQLALIEDIHLMEKRTKILEAINKLSISILGKRNLIDIAWEIAKNTADHLGLEDCVVFEVDHKKQQLTQVAAYYNKLNEDNSIKNKQTLKIGEGIVGTVAQTGRYEVVNDTSKDTRYLLDEKERLSEIAVPIIANGKVIGIIDSEHSIKNFFTEDHIETFLNIASLAAAQFNSGISYKKEKANEEEKNNLLKELEQSNEELKSFAHIVSHDLKSPLRSINTLVTWILEDNEGKFSDDTNNNFNMLLKKIDKMDHLINGILKYASIDKIGKSNNIINLNKLVNDIIEVIYIPDNIKVEIKGSLPKIKGDKFRIQQLFQNLIVNGIKYNDKEEGYVHINVEEKDKWYIFSVADNGIGIEEKYHGKIFEVFETLGEERSDSTGIGLSIVNKIIKMLGGDIWLDSKVGEGTTFYFKLKK